MNGKSPWAKRLLCLRAFLLDENRADPPDKCGGKRFAAADGKRLHNRGSRGVCGPVPAPLPQYEKNFDFSHKNA